MQNDMLIPYQAMIFFFAQVSKSQTGKTKLVFSVFLPVFNLELAELVDYVSVVSLHKIIYQNVGNVVPNLKRWVFFLAPISIIV